MKIVAFSDTHGQHSKLVVPPGDMLICCGDVCARGDWPSFTDFARWFVTQPHRHKILVPGNHDWPCQQNYSAALAQLPGCHLIHDCAVNIDGFAIYGTAWQPVFGNWAFNVKDSLRLRHLYGKIPDATEILITHCPPRGTLDVNGWGEVCGAKELAWRIKHLPLLRCHIFGHVHGGAGSAGNSHNVAVVDEQYQLARHPVTVEL